MFLPSSCHTALNVFANSKSLRLRIRESHKKSNLKYITIHRLSKAMAAPASIHRGCGANETRGGQLVLSLASKLGPRQIFYNIFSIYSVQEVYVKKHINTYDLLQMDLPTFQASICVNHLIQIDCRHTLWLIESVARSPRRVSSFLLRRYVLITLFRQENDGFLLRCRNRNSTSESICSV